MLRTLPFRGVLAAGLMLNLAAARPFSAPSRHRPKHQRSPSDGVALAAADDNASYELGYYPDNKKWDGKYRSIKVKVAQGDTQIRHRKGYFAVDPIAPQAPNHESDVAAALEFNAPATQVVFMAQAKPTDPGKVR